MKDLAFIVCLAAAAAIVAPTAADLLTALSPKYIKLEAQKQQLEQTARDYQVYREAVKDAR
ncbi:hypothetical protein H6F90_02935 [Trichocoleus sp. FACHB-591]|uniref:hypothetical protein n=1 Tax=Trichocoleus TaxID=450526 RepID=UPI0016821BEF|nr:MULTISPECIES: hypothetical protein [Trichocoleus]MBD2094106.1 hypothetical protein [Trichocoleus sp. FACHB-591]